MHDKMRASAFTREDKGYKVEALRSSQGVYIGIDIGSTSSDIVVLDDDGKIFYSDYRRTKGQPIETVRSQLGDIFKIIKNSDIKLVSATGSAGRFLAKLLDISFINEVPAQAAAINFLYPQFQQATIIEMGGQDSKLIFLSCEQGIGRVRDFVLNTVCAAGTGSFLDQQAQRLGISIEDEFGRLALESKTVPRMAGRCSVFAKSDMIHLQQQATPTCEIIAGLCYALVRNLKSNLGGGRKFVKPIIFTGGVAANIGVVSAVKQVFELAGGELIVPESHFFTGAIGAVLVAKNKIGKESSNGQIHLEKIDSYLSKRGTLLNNAPRREPLSKSGFPEPKSVVYEHLLSNSTEPINAYLGVDVGSISTNVVVMNEQKQVLAKAYLMTAGQPLEAVRQGLDIVGEKVIGKVRILGAATTGSGRYLTGDFIGADVVINEITAQAAGAAIVNPKVDTIFEIGGQDSKYISLENGVVVDFEMNHACAAGTGSFLEEQSQRLGININKEFAELAFKSMSPIKLGERCTVFMESDLLNYQQQGAETSELVAGLSYSIVANYLNRVVGHRRIGENICFQGGTAFNKAVWSAFEKETGKSILVPDHHEVTGALGAASIAAEHMKKNTAEHGQNSGSNFRGFENLISIKYSVETFACEKCSNNCEIKKVMLAGSEPLFYGSRCDRYNLKKNSRKTDSFDAFGYRRQMLLEFSGLADASSYTSKSQDEIPETAKKPKIRIGIPLALVNWQLLPLFARFFKSLGFEVVLSGRTNKQTIRKGVESVNARPCFPVKVAYGHIAELIEKKVNYVFIPSIVSMTVDYSNNQYSKLCPYVQTLAYQAKTVFDDKLGDERGHKQGCSEETKTEILTIPIRLGEGRGLLRKSFVKLGKKLGVSSFAVSKAVKQAFTAQGGFERALREKGAELLREVGPDQKIFVLVSRPYNGCDEGINLQLSQKLADLGIKAIPMDMLDFSRAQLSDEILHKSVYWTYGQKILRAAEIIKRDPRLFAIYLSNFGCGPDSFLLTFFKEIMSPKPCLQLELDEHSADAGVITRLEAFLESLKHYHTDEEPKEQLEKTSLPKSFSCGSESASICDRLGKGKRLYIPYMSDCAYGIAACFRAFGQPAEVMPMADQSALLEGRRYTTGKECLPCAITAGDMLKVLKTEGVDPEKVTFFMPGGTGPCRFGMYNCMHRLVLKYAGANGTHIISPNQDASFYKEVAGSVEGSGTIGFMKHMWAGAVGIDLLGKLILRIRPFAKEPEFAEQVYEKSIKRWIQTVENNIGISSLKRLMELIAADFAKVQLDHESRKPRIGVVGEIYVRSHPFANMEIIKRLESLGAVCELSSLAEWVYYINFVQIQKARSNRQVYGLFVNRTFDYLQHKIEKALAEPLERRFGRLSEEPIKHIIKYASPYLHHSFEGEAILSIGKMIELYHNGVGGVVNVMPFSCMPSTVVSTQTMRVSRDCANMPILNLSFDGQEDSTLTTRLEAFVEQVRHEQEANLAASEIMAG